MARTNVILDIPCPVCKGSGEMVKYRICLACGGSKRLILPVKRGKSGWKQLSQEEKEIIKTCTTPREAQVALEQQGYFRDYRTIWGRMKGSKNAVLANTERDGSV